MAGQRDPVEVAEEIADRLGLTGAGHGGRGRRRVHSRPRRPTARGGQLAAITELAAERGLDLGRCAAYFDSANDIPMLSAEFPGGGQPGRQRWRSARQEERLADPRLPDPRPGLGAQGCPAAAAAGAAVGVAVGVAKAISAIRDGGPPST